MGKVVSGLTMSLDGYIAGPNDGPEHPLGENGMQLFDWYESGDTEYTVPSSTMAFHVSAESAQMLDETFSAIGALVTGRRTFDITDGWGGQHPVDAPIIVLTHEVPHEWIERYPDAPFTFVTDGIESAVAQAQAVAGDRDVAVGAASLVQQALKAGLLDEMHVSLVPLLLGGGVRLFEDFGSEPVKMEITRAINDPDVTQITYRVVK